MLTIRPESGAEHFNVQKMCFQIQPFVHDILDLFAIRRELAQTPEIVFSGMESPKFQINPVTVVGRLVVQAHLADVAR